MSEQRRFVDARTRGGISDATRYCEGCTRWTGHRMTENGEYTCLICGSGGGSE